MINELKNELNTSITENGAAGYKTTSSYLLDMTFKVASYRNCSNSEIINDFIYAYNEDPLLAIKWLFYVRDVRGGLGERRLFRVITKYLAETKSTELKNLLPLFAEYGRWDDLINLINTPVDKEVIALLKSQLAQDTLINNFNNNESISLLAKWMPSENTSSYKTRELARIIAMKFGWSPRYYRKTLSALRNKLNIVESKMSANEWNEVNYEAVPSKANLIYKDAFLSHDAERRYNYLEQLKNGNAKINGSVNFPYEIVRGYEYKVDDTREALWKALPDLVNKDEFTLVVADGSGSMTCQVGNSVTALNVANSLAIYFAERAKGEYKDHYITFSEHPQLVHLVGDTLFEKLRIARRYNEVANTNIEAVFDLILNTAKKNNLTQAELPKNILIISDMEFDKCASSNVERSTGRYISKHLFEVLAERYNECGYELPRLIFWNVNSRTNTIPITQNKLGVILVSGFSVNTLKMILNNELDPYQALLKTINDPRYDKVEEVFNRI